MRRCMHRVAALAAPIASAQLSQSVFSLIDTAMIGVLGPVSLAAVGLASFANFVAVSLVTGLSTGVQVMAARRLGDGGHRAAYPILVGGTVLALAVGIPVSVALFWATPILFPYLNDDPAVLAEGSLYLQARLAGLALVALTMVFRGYWSGIQRPMVYLRCLLLMHVFNVALNYGLIYGRFGLPELGSLGAGVGTTLSFFLGLGYYLYVFSKQVEKDHARLKVPDRKSVATMLRLSVPSSVQLVFFALGFEVLFWVVGTIGTNELAAASVLVVVTLIGMRLGLSLGLASASLVGQAIGEGDFRLARRWAWEVAKIGATAMVLLGMPLIAFPEVILGGFIHEEGIIAIARIPMQLVGLGFIFDAIGIVMLNSLLGAGASRQVMTITTSLQWLLFLPLAWLVGPFMGFGLLGVWLCFVGYRFFEALILTGVWQAAHWRFIKV